MSRTATGRLVRGTAGLGAFGTALRNAGYTTDAVTELLRTTSLSGSAAERAVGRRRLAERDDELAVLVRLFLLGEAVQRAAAAASVAPVPLAELEQAGLLTEEGDALRAHVRVVPHGDVFVLADAPTETTDAMPADLVAGVQGPSVTLAKLTVRRPVGSALDVGTGNGIQAFIASAHAERVVATDVNTRALAFAQAGAVLNGVDNVEFRQGSAFEPVADERFDLVVANPPYVVSPDTFYAFRDSGLRGDEISRRFVQQTPQHLAEGGFATLMISWLVDPVRSWEEPLRAWLDGSGCDAWLLHHGTDDPLTHAARWLRNLGQEDVAAFEKALDRWVRYFEELGATAVATGIVILRRRSGGDNWIRTEQLADRFETAGDQILDLFANADLLARGDEALLAASLRVHPAHSIRSTFEVEDGALAARRHVLRSERGLVFELGIDDSVLAVLARLDGSVPVRDALAAVAADAGLPPEEFTPAAIEIVRRLVELGFLCS